MKTQLIYLDPHDDHASTRDKLGWARADRIVLIWPPHGRILTRRLDLILLMRAARAQGARLGLVTHDPDVRAHAEDHGVPVFDSPDRFPETAWASAPTPSGPPPTVPPSRLPRPLRPPPGWDRRGLTSRRRQLQRNALALLPVLALLSLAVTIVPAAVVELDPLTTEQTSTFEVLLDLDHSNTPSSEGLPARRWEQTFEGDLRQPTSGRVLVPSAPAEGVVVFTNLTNDEQTIPAGTGVRTAGGERFVTLSEVVLEGPSGRQASVEVRATEDGDAGNVAAAAVDATEGSLGLLVTVTNPEPTSGGGSASRAGVSAGDVQRLKEALARQLLQEARSTLESGLAAGERIAPDSLQVVNVVMTGFEPAIGQPGESLSLHMQLEIEAVTYSESDLLVFADALLARSASSAVSSVPGTRHAELTTLLTQADQSLRYSGNAGRRIYRAVESDEVRRWLAGRDPSDAAALLQRRIDLAKPPRILLWPAWLPRLPLLPVRIDVHWAWDSP